MPRRKGKGVKTTFKPLDIEIGTPLKQSLRVIASAIPQTVPKPPIEIIEVKTAVEPADQDVPAILDPAKPAAAVSSESRWSDDEEQVSPKSNLPPSRRQVKIKNRSYREVTGPFDFSNVVLKPVELQIYKPAPPSKEYLAAQLAETGDEEEDSFSEPQWDIFSTSTCDPYKFKRDFTKITAPRVERRRLNFRKMMDLRSAPGQLLKDLILDVEVIVDFGGVGRLRFADYISSDMDYAAQLFAGSFPYTPELKTFAFNPNAKEFTPKSLHKPSDEVKGAASRIETETEWDSSWAASHSFDRGVSWPATNQNASDISFSAVMNGRRQSSPIDHSKSSRKRSGNVWRQNSVPESPKKSPGRRSPRTDKRERGVMGGFGTPTIAAAPAKPAWGKSSQDTQVSPSSNFWTHEKGGAKSPVKQSCPLSEYECRCRSRTVHEPDRHLHLIAYEFLTHSNFEEARDYANYFGRWRFSRMKNGKGREFHAICFSRPEMEELRSNLQAEGFEVAECAACTPIWKH